MKAKPKRLLTPRLSAVALGISRWLRLAAATFTDANWTALGSGVNDQVVGVAVSGCNVYAGGYFTNAGSLPASYIAKWNGSGWSSLGSGAGGDPSFARVWGARAGAPLSSVYGRWRCRTATSMRAAPSRMPAASEPITQPNGTGALGRRWVRG